MVQIVGIQALLGFCACYHGVLMPLILSFIGRDALIISMPTSLAAARLSILDAVYFEPL